MPDPPLLPLPPQGAEPGRGALTGLAIALPFPQPKAQRPAPSQPLQSTRLSWRPTPPYRSRGETRPPPAPVLHTRPPGARSSYPAALHCPGLCTAAGGPPAPGARMTTLNCSPPSGPFYSNTRPGAPLTPTQNTRGHTLPTLLRVRDRQRAAARTQPHLPPHRRSPHNFAVPPPPSGALAPPRLELFGLPAGPPGPVPSFSGRPRPAPVLSESLGRAPKL